MREEEGDFGVDYKPGQGLDLRGVKTNPERLKAGFILSYRVEDWVSHQIDAKPTEVVCEGATIQEAYQRAVQHMVGIEMGGDTRIVKDAKVRMGNREMSWEDFMAEIFKSK